MRQTIIHTIQQFYIPQRLKEIDSDFLEFEEELATEDDLNIILSKVYDLFQDPPAHILETSYWDNPHNSIILYITGLTNEFDHVRARADTKGGSPPDCI